ncbi:MAG: glycerol-3-phosphate dehydrogenase/oxidase [Pyrinomonadaceae bacterium]|nr:glycerol-3-phosphate dehydrogenase/oxidase [Pyrinomonadaceae bacterium]
MKRSQMFSQILNRQTDWDIIIIGGGATGIGCAVDAASRGYEVLLLEQHDFGKGTSSRSTKLVHGGVRYLEQGNISLVMEALKERGILRQNAPHLVEELAFIVPNYEWWEMPFYGVGLKIYNLLSGKYGFGKSQILSKSETLKRLPTIKKEGLRGGVIYFDGQFDDTRLLINLAQTAHQQGATLLNYARVFQLTKDEDGLISGVNFVDEQTGQLHQIKAKAVINATGAFCDKVRQFSEKQAEKIIAPSQGIHLTFDRSFLPTDTAIMIPHTSDGRVLFAIPWHNHTIVGTTDTPVEKVELEPKALDEEIEFILATAKEYLHKPPTRDDILSVFVGIRPLVKAGDAKSTSSLSRDHTIEIDKSGLVTITGGKWTTYRNMAEDCINQTANLVGLPEKECVTKTLKIYQSPINEGEKLHPDFDYTIEDILCAIREEMALSVEDVLARRTRILFLNAKAALEIAPQIAEIMAKELGKDETWKIEQLNSFQKVAECYTAR